MIKAKARTIASTVALVLVITAIGYAAQNDPQDSSSTTKPSSNAEQLQQNPNASNDSTTPSAQSSEIKTNPGPAATGGSGGGGSTPTTPSGDPAPAGETTPPTTPTQTGQRVDYRVNGSQEDAYCITSYSDGSSTERYLGSRPYPGNPGQRAGFEC